MKAALIRTLTHEIMVKGTKIKRISEAFISKIVSTKQGHEDLTKKMEVMAMEYRVSGQ